MRKYISRLGLGFGTLAIVIAGAAAFSAFEAHVVNVTASIENALVVPQELNGISFGTVFPEEVLHRNLDISLSESFVGEGRVDDIEYMIRQKPKCQANDVENPIQFAQVTEEGQAFLCPSGYHELPLLCPFLSKHELTTDGQEAENDSTGIDAFHGPLVNWTMLDTLATQVTGRLVKSGGDLNDTWDIDLHAPCFKDQCAQDGVIPANYQPDARLDGQMFGCDLWVEVTEISRPGDQKPPGTLTVTKIVNNDNGGGTKVVADFPLFVDGWSVTSGVATTTSAGTHFVSEISDPNYTSVFGGACGPGGLVSVPSGGSVACTITNTSNPSPMGTLTINKVLDPAGDPGKFDLQIDGVTDPDADDIGNGGSTGAQSFIAGSIHGFGEIAGTGTSLSDYTTVISGPADCDDGSVTIIASTNINCTITNTANPGHLIVHKTVITHVPGTTTTAADFQMTVDGSNVVQDASNTVTPGNHTVGEVSNPNYTMSFSAECPGGVANVPAGATVTCTVTNEQLFATLTINKVVNNIHGGNNVAADFHLFASNSDATTELTNGASSSVAVGSLFINEQGVTGYQAAFTGDCNSSGQITLAAGDNKQCTITNTDLSANITLSKVVDSGTASPFSFVLRIDGSVVPPSSSVPVTSNSAHAITEDAHTGYHFVSITGSVKCPAVLGGTATLDEGEAISCTIHNAQN